VQLDPKDADSHYRMALTHLKLGGATNLQGAFAELSRTVELDKTNRDAQLKLGELYLLGTNRRKRANKPTSSWCRHHKIQKGSSSKDESDQ
jgi:hypothetical protein